MHMRYFPAILFLACTCGFAQQPDTGKFLRPANLIVDAIMSDTYEPLVAEYTPENLSVLPLAKTQIFFRNTIAQFGKLRRIDPPKPATSQYAVVTFYFEKGVQDLKLYLDPANKIDGFIFVANTDNPAPAAPSASTSATESKPAAPVVPDKQKTELQLPFKGSFIVSTGGEPREGAAARNLLTMRWAYEFTATVNGVQKKSVTGKANEDYFGFGMDVVSPSDGVVTDVIEGVRDNVPGTTVNHYASIGNAVIIHHQANEHSVLGYLKMGSVRVKPGDKILRGQVIAQIGNSGRSVEPSLHFHLQDGPLLQSAQGVKFYFERARVTIDGKTETRLVHSPMIGDVLTPEP